MSAFAGPAFEPLLALAPLTLVDIGARGGLQPNWRPARPHLRVIAFEPDADEHARLAKTGDPRDVHINAAVYRQPATVTLNVTRSPGASSLYEPNFAFLSRFPDARRFEVVKRTEIRAQPLDDLLRAQGIADVDFIKIDAQGAEFPILEGARETLATRAFGVEVEVQFAPLYRGQSRFGDVHALMETLGYALLDLRPANWKRAVGAGVGKPKGQLVFGDALYLKSPAAFADTLARLEAPARGAKLARAIGVCLLYGYVDYALELLDLHGGAFDAGAAAAIRESLRSDMPLSARVPHFPGKGTLAQFFYRLSRALEPSVGGWATGGRHLGNLD